MEMMLMMDDTLRSWVKPTSTRAPVMMQSYLKRTWRTQTGCTVSTINLIKEPFLIPDLSLYLNPSAYYSNWEVGDLFFFDIYIYIKHLNYTLCSYSYFVTSQGWSVSTSITKNVSEEAVSSAKLMPMLLLFNHLIVYLNLHVWLWPSNDLLISLHRTEEVHTILGLLLMLVIPTGLE